MHPLSATILLALLPALLFAAVSPQPSPCTSKYTVCPPALPGNAFEGKGVVSGSDLYCDYLVANGALPYVVGCEYNTGTVSKSTVCPQQHVDIAKYEKGLLDTVDTAGGQGSEADCPAKAQRTCPAGTTKRENKRLGLPVRLTSRGEVTPAQPVVMRQFPRRGL